MNSRWWNVVLVLSIAVMLVVLVVAFAGKAQ